MMITTMFSKSIPVIIAVVLAVCSGASHEKVLASGLTDSPTPETISVQKESAQSLSPDIIYNILVGEIALQRRNLDLAYAHQLKGADLARDAAAAERATMIALHRKNQAEALVAVRRWIKYAPKDVQARRMAVMLAIQSDAYEEALQQLKLLVQLREKQGQDGFVYAIAAVASGQDRQKALRLMRSLATGYKGNPRASYAVALAAIMAQSLEVAEREVRQTIKRKPDMARARVLLGRIYVERKDTAGAMRVMQQALDILPDSTVLRSAYARMLLDFDKPELAYRQFQKLHTLTPDDADVRFSLGVLSLRLDRRAQAKEHFAGLLKAKARVVDVSFYMGRIEEMEGRLDAAIAWYAKVDGGNYLFDAQIRTAGLLADQGDLPRARSMLGDMRTRMPERSVDLYMLEGEILRKHSTNDELVKLYGAALKEHPEDLDLLYARALSASNEGRVDILEQDIQVILRHKPDHADALNALGYTLADQTDRYQEALGYIKKALALKPDSPAILDSMGWVQYRMGNNKEALDYLRRAFEKIQDVEVAAHLGELLWVTGQQQEAQKILQDALKKHPGNKYLQRTIKRLGVPRTQHE